MVVNSTLTTNFNVGPWFDDFNPNKHFYRQLYVPERAVQARELTQVQSTTQEQIRRFADHIFKEGSLVSGGQFNIDLSHDYVKLTDVNTLLQNVNVANFANTLITGSTSGVKAIVVGSATGSEIAANTKTLFIRYTSAGTDTTTKTFLSGETLISNTGFQAKVLVSNTACGLGSNFSINEGIVYAKTHFLNFQDQSIVLDRYTNTPSYKVGFYLKEEIITANDDNTLNDPAQGAYNYSAPGADRLKITATLTKVPLVSSANTEFVELFEIKNGIVQKKFETTQYSLIRDELARRTDDESGDYYVYGLDVRIREHLDDGTNQGYLPLNQGGNTSLLAIGIEPGKAYVKGYDIQTLVPTYVETRKGIDYLNLNTQNVSTNYGNYVLVKEVVGSFDFNSGAILKLYDTAKARITNRTFSTGSQTGALLGTARFKALELDTGTFGTAGATYRLYLHDIKMVNGAFTAVRNIFFDNPSTADIGADIVTTGGIAKLVDTDFNIGIYKLPVAATRSIRDSNGDIQTTFTFLKSYPVTIATSGTVSLSTGLSDEIFTESVGTLNSIQKENFIVTLNASANVSMSGTVTVTSGANTVTGSSTNFTRLNVGDKIEIQDIAGTYFVSSIASDSSMTILPNAASSGSTKTYRKVYKVGDIVDYRLHGSTAGTARTIVINTATSATLDMKETISNAVSATISTRLNKAEGREIKKTLRRSRYVKIDCSTAGTTGPFDLGISDVFDIQFVRKGTSFTTDNDGTDVTSQFIFDNGQRDNIYDHARLIKNGASLSGSDILLVKLDYFYHDYSQGVGYYSIDSYPIDDVHAANTIAISTKEIPVYTSATNGVQYNLRNCIDTRLTRSQTASDSTTIAGASVNPGASTALESPSGGVRQTAPDQNFTIDYSYYLGRKDLVVLNGAGQFRIIEGVPNTVSVTPNTPVDSMSVARITITPYPSLAPTVATSIGRPDLATQTLKTAYKRYTMRDIGVIDNRVGNLEYYASLNLLEQDAINLKIPDANGLDRFKNGIFVDPFNSHVFGDLTNADYRIAVDSRETCIRPIFDLDDIKTDYSSGTNVTCTNDIVTLSYSEVSIINQPNATTNRNTASQFWRFKGNLVINPEQDFWTDTQQNPDVQMNLNGTNDVWNNLGSFLNSWGAVWNDWQTTWTGIPTSTSEWMTGVQRPNEELRANGFGGATDVGRVEVTTTTSEQGQRRINTNVNVTSTTTTQNIGNFVTDVSLVPFIRPQTIKLSCTGLKSNIKLYVFFDDEDMTDYCTLTNSSFTPIDSEGDGLITDQNNNMYCLLRLPTEGKRFRVGTKKIRVTDSITNNDDATTTAEAYFVAHGLNTTKQNTIISTTVPTFSATTNVETRVVTNTQTTEGEFFVDGTFGGWAGDPLAQTFEVNLPTHIPGYFATSIELYFQQVPDSGAITVELREVDTAGQIQTTVIPYSRVTLDASAVNISDNATASTKFTFPGPVYLQNNMQYAFVIRPLSNNPNFYVWTAKLGQDDITTGARISQQPYVGVFFVSANNTTWSPIQDEDVKFKLNRASFNIASPGSAIFKNNSIEKFGIGNLTGQFTIYGETVKGEHRLTFASVSGGSIANTMFVTGVTSNTVGQIVSITGPTYRVRVDGPKTFNVNENVTFQYANTASTGITATVATQAFPTGVLEKFDSNLNQIRFRNANGSFVAGERIIGRISNTSATISTILPIKYSTAEYDSSFITVDGTSISWEAKGTSNTAIVDSDYQFITINDNNYFLNERAIYGATQEASLLGGSKSLNVRATLYSGLEYVSPVIDLNRSHTVLIHNIVNANSTGETNPSGGAAINKYISQRVALADRQDAEDMKVYLSAYRPPGTTITLYGKLLNGEDSDIFTDKNWMALELDSVDFYSSSTNQNDYKEFIYNLPESTLTGTNDEFQYQNSQGVTLTGYKYFALKIVLLSTDSAVIPKVADLRVIALQK